MREISVGLVGYGMGGSVFHAPLIRSIPQLRLATVATSRKEQVQHDLPRVRVVNSWPEMLSDPGIDLVVISTPTSTHFEIAEAALAAGKHVVVDKPFAAGVHEADALMALAAQQSLRLSVFQNRRWDNGFLTARHCIDRGWLGAVYHYEAHFDRFRPRIKPGWREESETASGILYDLGAHLIDQALVLFGMPRAVTADVLIQRPEARAVDYFHLILDYGRARVILHSATLVRAPGPHFAVHGDAGSFLKSGMDPQEGALLAGDRPGHPRWGLDPAENYGEITAEDGSHRSIETVPGSYEKFYELMASCLLDRGPLPVDPADSRNGLIVIEAARRSAAERRTVVIS